MSRFCCNVVWALFLAVVGLLGGCATSEEIAARAATMRSRGHTVISTQVGYAPSPLVPTTEDITRLEDDLARLLARPDQRLDSKEKRKLSDYYVVYFSSVYQGRNVIVAKGTHVTLPRPVYDETTATLDAFGGGDLFFKAYYDPESQKVLHAEYNAAL